MRNFDYLHDLGLTDLHRYCAAAEEFQVSAPKTSAFHARQALEYIVYSIYNLKHAEIPERAKLWELMDDEPFSGFINNADVMRDAHYVRSVGNKGAHVTGVVSQKHAYFCLLDLYRLVAAVLIKLQIVAEVAPFDRNLIPSQPEISVMVPAQPAEPTQVTTTASPTAAASTTPVEPLPSILTEEETREKYIDFMLREAKWTVLEQKHVAAPSRACIEIEVQGMPSESGTGYADYVLFGSNGKPLAVIEAKKTTRDPQVGRHQAELYADCLQAQYGVRPVIYYTNGFETHIIDGLGYPPRKLYAFHTEDELERLIQKRGRQDITDTNPKAHITDRYYQKMAIKAACEHFNNMHRRALIVMATGTGKTRVAISLVEVLKRNEWVKNVLFLADRTSLVKQAQKNFHKLLPHETNCILSDTREPDLTARMMFSTYQTMINHVDTDDKTFTIGRFDLIIIDEAHRSIFGKYGAIFNYFDSMLLGLTATPRDEVDRSTYDIFQLEQGSPNYAYEYETAVEDNYLVNYVGFKRGTLLLENGIKYNNLSPEEQEQLEKVWEHEAMRRALSGGEPRDIGSNELFTYIHNIDTINLVLQDLMENGLKVQDGERIGKTIIFAAGHNHAKLIVEQFNKLYPEYGPDFCVLIDNQVNYAQDLIDKFEVRDNAPQIAVSVDMLDTGIDVPDVLNLVFFKRVKSKIKFMQMIGRGTRLSPDIYGQGDDKKEFYIFDWCCNLEFFEKNPNGKDTEHTMSLTEKLFGLRSDIAFHLQNAKHQENEFAKGLHDELKAKLFEQVKELSDHHISVRSKWAEVCHFKEQSSWVSLSNLDTWTLKNDIAPLITKNTSDVDAKRFDVLMLQIELSRLDDEVSGDRAINNVIKVAGALESKATIPQVNDKMDTIHEVLHASWEAPSLSWLEKVRTELRELVKFLVGEKDKWFVINIQDQNSFNGIGEGITTRVSYKENILDFLSQHRDLPVLDKIYTMQQLTTADVRELERILWTELGSREDYDRYTEDMLCGDNVAAFIRSMIGVDRKVAMARFSDFLSGAQLNSDQEEFLSTIISYVCENGDITVETVAEQDPFADYLGTVFGDYRVPLALYINNIHAVINPVTA